MPTPYDTTQPLPGTQQTGNQATAPAPVVNTSSTVGNIPITMAPPAPQPAGMPQPQPNVAPQGIMTPNAGGETLSTFSPAPAVQGVGAMTQGVARDATVAGQMDTLLQNESPYMKQARDYANRDMNARGLMNSSLAVASSQEAAIKSALPIASQDASTHFSQAQDNLNWLNKFGQDENAYLRDIDKLGIDTRARALLNSQDLGNDLQRITAQTDADIRRQASALNTDLQKSFLDQQSAEYKDFTGQIKEIQISSLADAQKTKAIADALAAFQTRSKAQILMYKAMSNGAIDMSAFIPPDGAGTGTGTGTGAGTGATQGAAGGSSTASSVGEAIADGARDIWGEFERRFVPEGITQNPVTYGMSKLLPQFAEDAVNDVGHAIADIFGW